MDAAAVCLGIVVIWWCITTVGVAARCTLPEPWGFSVCLQVGGYASLYATIGLFIGYSTELTKALRCDADAASEGESCYTNLALLALSVATCAELFHLVGYVRKNFCRPAAVPAFILSTILIAVIMANSPTPTMIVSPLIASLFMSFSSVVSLFELCSAGGKDTVSSFSSPV